MLTLTLALLTAVDSTCTCFAIVSHAKNLNIWHNRFVFSVSFTSNWCRKSFIEAWHWEKILIQNSTISSYSLSGDKNANRLEKMSVAAHRTCDCPEFKFWTDITGLEAQLLDSCLFFCFFPWHATDLTHPGPSCFWKYSEILIAFIRFFFCVYHPGQFSKWTEAIWKGDVSHCKVVVGQIRSQSLLTLSCSRRQKLRIWALFYPLNFKCTAILWPYTYSVGSVIALRSSLVLVMPIIL